MQRFLKKRSFFIQMMIHEKCGSNDVLYIFVLRQIRPNRSVSVELTYNYFDSFMLERRLCTILHFPVEKKSFPTTGDDI